MGYTVTSGESLEIQRSLPYHFKPTTPPRSIPFLGVAVLIADTGYELYAACETITDLDQLYSELDMADDVMRSVCDPGLPDAGKVWDGVVEKSED